MERIVPPAREHARQRAIEKFVPPNFMEGAIMPSNVRPLSQTRKKSSPGSERTCPQFQTLMEEVPVSRGRAIMPIRRCLLAERMVVHLQATGRAEEVVRALAVNPGVNPPRCMHGPDLDVIEHSPCTTGRCASKCSPAYREMLSQFQVEDSEGIDCEAEDNQYSPADTIV